MAALQQQNLLGCAVIRVLSSHLRLTLLIRQKGWRWCFKLISSIKPTYRRFTKHPLAYPCQFRIDNTYLATSDYNWGKTWLGTDGSRQIIQSKSRASNSSYGNLYYPRRVTRTKEWMKIDLHVSTRCVRPKHKNLSSQISYNSNANAHWSLVGNMLLTGKGPAYTFTQAPPRT